MKQSYLKPSQKYKVKYGIHNNKSLTYTSNICLSMVISAETSKVGLTKVKKMAATSTGTTITPAKGDTLETPINKGQKRVVRIA